MKLLNDYNNKMCWSIFQDKSNDPSNIWELPLKLFFGPASSKCHDSNFN